MKRILFMIVLFAVAITQCACELLPLQTTEKYEGKSLNPYTGMNCLEFLESKQDDSGQFLLRNMRAAIRECGLEELYSQMSVKRTYLLLDNSQLTEEEIAEAQSDPEAKQKLTNKLLLHIIQGNYHAYGTLKYEPTTVISMYESSDYIITLNLDKSSSRYTEGRLSVSCTNIMKNTSSSTTGKSTNYFFTNGVGHILNKALTL